MHRHIPDCKDGRNTQLDFPYLLAQAELKKQNIVVIIKPTYPREILITVSRYTAINGNEDHWGIDDTANDAISAGDLGKQVQSL